MSADLDALIARWRTSARPDHKLAAAELARLRAENEALRHSVKTANDQAERFERLWYLRGDELEALRTVIADHNKACLEECTARARAGPCAYRRIDGSQIYPRRNCADCPEDHMIAVNELTALKGAAK